MPDEVEGGDVVGAELQPGVRQVAPRDPERASTVLVEHLRRTADVLLANAGDPARPAAEVDHTAR